MLRDILKIFKDKGCSEIVGTSDIIDILEDDDIKYIKASFNIEILDDLRSAAFYANGETNVNNKPMILIFNGDYLPNIYTAITEAWFQKLNINIIVLFKKYDDIKVEYLERCIPDIITLYEEDVNLYKDKLFLLLQNNRPSMINMQYNMKNENKIKYGKIISILENVLKKDDEVFLYNAIDKKANFNILNIDKKYKYGILSKYMGYITAKNKKTLIILPYDLLKIDLNIFNNRYLNENVKIILIDKIEEKSNLIEWISNNNIYVDEENEITEKILKKFWESNKSNVLIIKEGK